MFQIVRKFPEIIDESARKKYNIPIGNLERFREESEEYIMRKLRDCLKSKKGFSLVELIVVIVIILVLAATIVPNVTKYIKQAGDANIKNNASIMLTQIQAEVAEKYADAVKSNKKFVPATAVAKVKIDNKEAAYSATDVTAATKTTSFSLDTTDFTVKSFMYVDGSQCILWTSAAGWGDPAPVAD